MLQSRAYLLLPLHSVAHLFASFISSPSCLQIDFSSAGFGDVIDTSRGAIPKCSVKELVSGVGALAYHPDSSMLAVGGVVRRKDGTR